MILCPVIFGMPIFHKMGVLREIPNSKSQNFNDRYIWVRGVWNWSGACLGFGAWDL
jgi:hypothetical protein